MKPAGVRRGDAKGRALAHRPHDRGEGAPHTDEPEIAMTFFAPTAFDVNWRDRKCGRRDDMCIREGIDARATFSYRNRRSELYYEALLPKQG